MRLRSTCTRMKRIVWRMEGTAHNPKHTTPWVKHCGRSVLLCGHVRLPMELVPLYLLMMWPLTKAEGRIQVFRAILSAHIQPNASELIGRRFTAQMDNVPKHTAKATKVFKAKKWNVLQWPSQSPDLDPIECAFRLLKTKLKGKFPKNKQELKSVAAEARRSDSRHETHRLVRSMGSKL